MTAPSSLDVEVEAAINAYLEAMRRAGTSPLAIMIGLQEMQLRILCGLLFEKRAANSTLEDTMSILDAEQYNRRLRDACKTATAELSKPQLAIASVLRGPKG